MVTSGSLVVTFSQDMFTSSQRVGIQLALLLSQPVETKLCPEEQGLWVLWEERAARVRSCRGPFLPWAGEPDHLLQDRLRALCRESTVWWRSLSWQWACRLHLHYPVRAASGVSADPAFWAGPWGWDHPAELSLVLLALESSRNPSSFWYPVSGVSLASGCRN